MDRKSLPNILTNIRFLLTIPLVLFLYLGTTNSFAYWNILSFFIFLLAVVTDKIDGYLARKFGSISSYGKLMDPLADKLIVITALILLTKINIAPVLATLVIVARALLVTGLRSYASKEGLVISASKIGKSKTLLQTVSIGLLLLGPTFALLDKAGYYLLLLATIVTAYSGLDYFLKYLSKRKDKD